MNKILRMLFVLSTLCLNSNAFSVTHKVIPAIKDGYKTRPLSKIHLELLHLNKDGQEIKKASLIFKPSENVNGKYFVNFENFNEGDNIEVRYAITNITHKDHLRCWPWRANSEGQ